MEVPRFIERKGRYAKFSSVQVVGVINVLYTKGGNFSKFRVFKTGLLDSEARGRATRK